MVTTEKQMFLSLQIVKTQAGKRAFFLFKYISILLMCSACSLNDQGNKKCILFGIPEIVILGKKTESFSGRTKNLHQKHESYVQWEPGNMGRWLYLFSHNLHCNWHKELDAHMAGKQRRLRLSYKSCIPYHS